MDHEAVGKTAEQTSIKVLMYRNVLEDAGPVKIHPSCVTLGQLRRQLELLDTCGYTPVTFNDCFLAAGGELQLPKRPVILTFDHACRDIYLTAFPLLKEFGMNAVIFALGDRINRVDPEGWFSTGELPELVRDEELIEMQEAGLEIGSNASTYADLTGLPEDAAWEEVAASKESLESLLRNPVTCFSYPFGAVNRRVKAMVASAGYRFACGIDAGQSHFAADPFNIRRIAVTHSTNVLSFGIKILSPYDHADWFCSRPDPAHARPGTAAELATEGAAPGKAVASLDKRS